MRTIVAATVVLATLLPGNARADDEAPINKPVASDTGPRLGEAHVQKWKFGMEVSASGGNLGRLRGTVTIPIRWPEQELRLVAKDLSLGVELSYKDYGTAKQMVVNFPRIADGKSARAVLIVEVTRHTMQPPEQTDGLTLPDAKTLPAELKPYLSPSPPLIESASADQGFCQADRRGTDQSVAPRPRDLRLGPQDDQVPGKETGRRAGPLFGGHRPRERRLQRA